MRRNVLVLILFSVFPLLATAQQYVEVKTPAFTVVTDAGEAQGREVAQRFELVRSAFGLFFNAKNATTPTPLTIVAFQNTKEFQQVLPRWVDQRLAPPGLWRPREDENVIAIDLATEGRKQSPTIGGLDFGLVRFGRLLMAGNSPPVPAWYDDGFTEYCSSVKWNGKQLEYGLPRSDVMRVLQSQAWLKLTQLFGHPPERPDDIEARRQTIYYAQSWMTIHYLMSAKAGAQLNRFVDLMQTQKMDTQEAIRRAFGVEPASFDNAVRNYFEMHTQNYRINVPEDFGRGEMEVRPLKPQEWTAALANIEVRSSTEHEAGEAMYKKVLAADPGNAAANRGLGMVELLHNDVGAAETHLSKAVSADPNDAIAHYGLALLARQKRRMTPQDAAPDMKQVLYHLKKAIEIAPNYAEAYELLSWAQAEEKNEEEARAAIEKAVDLNPRNETYALAMAQMEIQARNYGKAKPVLERLQGSTQPEVASYAYKALQTLGVNEQPASVATREQITAPQWRDPKAENKTEQPAAKEQEAAPAPNSRAQKIEFVKGELVSADCSKPPAVTIAFRTKGRDWTMYAPDMKKVLLIGEENFSCAWANRKAAVNFRQTGESKGEMISLELD